MPGRRLCVIGSGPEEKKLAVYRIGEERIILDRTKRSSGLPGVSAPDPGYRVGVEVGGVCVARGAVQIETDLRSAVVQQDLWRSCHLVRRDVHAESGGPRLLRRGVIQLIVVTLDGDVRLIH